MDKILEKIKPLVHECALIDATDIDFETSVREACEANMCGFYNKRWTCPPAVGTLEECKARCLKYKKALVFSTYDNVEDSFDIEGMLNVRADHDKVQAKVVDLIKDDLGEYLLLGAGGCTKCPKCSYPEPCRFKKEVIASVESHGINVVTLAAKTKLHYHNGENTVTYFSVIFFG